MTDTQEKTWNVCYQCWIKQYPEVTPDAEISPKQDTCFKCQTLNVDGIYVTTGAQNDSR